MIGERKVGIGIIVAGCETPIFFQLALGLSSPWTVTRSEFDAQDGRLDLYVDFPRGSRFACPRRFASGKSAATNSTPLSISPNVSATLRANRSIFAMTKTA